MTEPGFRALLAARGLKPRRSLGQNFLVDPNFLDALGRDLELRADDQVVEIGAGAGHLTDILARDGRRVWAFDVDPGILELARERLGPRPGLEWIEADGATFASRIRPEHGRRLLLVSNLPYGEWSRLTLAMMSSPWQPASIHVMVQRDVADRLLAKPGQAKYGPMAVLASGLHEVSLVRRAPARVFYPPPRVESAVVRLVRVHPSGFDCEPGRIEALHEALIGLFRHRRKRLKAALEAMERRSGKALPAEAWAGAEQRAESMAQLPLLRLAALIG